MSRSLTLSQINQRVTRALSLYPGTAVQLYAEDRISAAIQSTFELVFDKRFWPQFTSWNSWTLNESSGEVTADISAILKRWEDLGLVFRDGANKPLPRLPYGMNPYEITGTIPKFIEPYNVNARIFRVWPLASEGDVKCFVRTLPDEFTDDDVIDFDSECLIYGATYSILEDDGSIPGATAKYQNLFESRLRTLIENTQQMAIPILNDPNASIPTNWEWGP